MDPLSQIPRRRSGIQKPGTDRGRDRVLQLWVEHGARISARAAVLISRCINARTAALGAQSMVAMEGVLPSSSGRKRASSFGAFVISPRAISQRRRMREMRKKMTNELLRKEGEVKRKELEEKRRLQERKLEEHRLQKVKMEQKQHAEKQKLELKERERKAVEEKRRREEAKLVEEKAREEQTRKEEELARKAELTKKLEQAAMEKVQKRNPDGLKAPIIASGKVEDGGPTDKIKEVEGTPEDILRIIREWNKLCDDAEPFRRDPSMKRPRIEVKKQVNLMVNQIAASKKHVSLKVTNLCQVLQNAVRGGGSGGEAFAMREIAQRLVSESDGSVALNRTAAFAVGAVIVGVTTGAEKSLKMRNAFLGAFYKHCIYTMPAYVMRGKGEASQQYRERLGYKDGETPDSYMERSCGCVSLFAAVLQTVEILGPGQVKSTVANPFPLDIGWTWLARLANRDQRAVTPAIAFAFLEVAGYRLAKKYRRQFAKLMAVVQKAVVLQAVKSAPKGATSRLDTLIEEFVASGCDFPEPPKGSILPDKDMEFL